MARDKMDPFTRQVAKGMQDFGFRKIKKKKGNDHKWRYTGPKSSTTINYTLQNIAKERSRAGIIDGLRKKLIFHGVKEQDRLWLDQIALGLIAIRQGDDKDALEAKLLDGINSIPTLEVAKLAFELVRIAGAENAGYESTAIAKRQVEFDDKLKRDTLVRQIEKCCHRRFIGIMDRKLEEVKQIHFDLSHVYLPSPPSFSKHLVQVFELVPKDFAYNDDDECFSVFGEFKGGIAKVLKKHGLTDRFSVQSDTIEGSGLYTIKSSSIFDYFSMPALYEITTSAADELLEELSKTQVNAELHMK